MTQETPRISARGSICRGSRISPVSLLASHQPAKEKKEETSPTANPASSGSEPGRCVQNGARLDQLPRPRANPQSKRKPNKLSLSAANPRRILEPIETPAMFTAAKTTMAAMATPLSSQEEREKR